MILSNMKVQIKVKMKVKMKVKKILLLQSEQTIQFLNNMDYFILKLAVTRRVAPGMEICLSSQ